MNAGTDRPRPRVAILADDLIWATRLADGLRRAGGEPVSVRSIPALVASLPSVAGCLVDLTARGYDGIAAIGTAARAGVAVIAVGQHDDAPARRAARAAGAGRVHAYRTLFEHGDRELSSWIATISGSSEVVR